MRRAHYLKPNDRSETLHQCVWYDCETRAEEVSPGVTKHILVFGWAAYRRRRPDGRWTEPKWKRFTEGEDLWKWICQFSRPKKTLYVWAHNQPFDYSTSCGRQWLHALKWETVKAIIDSPPFVVSYQKQSSKLILTDTLNIWRMSLKEMGKLTGLEKLLMPLTWNLSASDDDYCRRDVEIIMQAVCQWADFLVREDMGKFCLTVASQAMQTFRHRYIEDNILIDDHIQALEIARSSYHGGRVEAFYIGRLAGPLYLLDVNSLYPYCMATYDFPVRLVTVSIHPSVVELRNILERYLCCARVLVETTRAVVPIKEQGKLIFPTGRFYCDCTTPELIYLLQHEQVRDVQLCAIYEKARPFVHFVQDLYQRRRECMLNANVVEGGHYKLLLNSFSGKWGQNGVKWVTIGRTDDSSTGFWREVYLPSRKVVNYRRWNNLIQRRESVCHCGVTQISVDGRCALCNGLITMESANSHPAIAAHITAYGRMILFALMRQISPKHYFYCDTDSVLVSKQGLEQVHDRIQNELLGGLKVVGEYRQGYIYGCKDYVLEGVRTCKGIRNEAIEFEPNSYRQDQWVGFRRALRKGWSEAPHVIRITKRLKRTYDKGIVGADGFVLPFHLDQ